jgi:uncharacterized FlaG/YvyC family protein
MVDPISNAPNVRDLASSPSRPQASPNIPGAVQPSTNLAPDQRVERLQQSIAKLIKKSLPTNSKLQITQDESTGTYIYRSVDPDTGEVIQQWPQEQMLALQKQLKQMEGLLLDKHV